jgi:hypothetical protein
MRLSAVSSISWRPMVMISFTVRSPMTLYMGPLHQEISVLLRGIVARDTLRANCTARSFISGRDETAANAAPFLIIDTVSRTEWRTFYHWLKHVANQV